MKLQYNVLLILLILCNAPCIHTMEKKLSNSAGDYIKQYKVPSILSRSKKNNVPYLRLTWSQVCSINDLAQAIRQPGEDEPVLIDPKDLTDLFLNNNRITILESKTFEPFSNAETLILWTNNISTIEPGAFDGLDNLIFLNLCDNDLETFDVSLLANLKKIKKLFLIGNKITKLIRTGATPSESLEEVLLQRNPLTQSVDAIKQLFAHPVSIEL